MADTETPEEATHLQVQPYKDSERSDPPEWYDDSINVGEVTNEEVSSE